MMTSDLVAPVIEPVSGRYTRDLMEINDDRKVRGFDYESPKRRSRRYVNPATVNVSESVGSPEQYTGQVDTTQTVTGTVSSRLDNVPAGFNQSNFEATLEYNPNA